MGGSILAMILTISLLKIQLIRGSKLHVPVARLLLSAVPSRESETFVNLFMFYSGGAPSLLTPHGCGTRQSKEIIIEREKVIINTFLVSGGINLI